LREDSTAQRKPGMTGPGRIEPLATLPLFFKLKGRRVVLAGASEGVRWKAELLAASGAEVQLFSGAGDMAPFAELAAHFGARAEADEGFGALHLHARAAEAADFTGAALAIGDFEDEGDIAHFVTLARAAGVPVNLIDNPAHCEFQFGAIVNRSPLIVSISTDGAAPVLGQAIRAKIESILPPGLAAWAKAARDWRPFVQAKKPSFALRRRFWERFTARALSSPATPPREADRLDMLATLEAETNAPTAGLVSLVGAGPGDAELLTLKAVRVLQAADIVLYDDLVSPQVLELARREAERMAVGKKGHGPACKQSDINRMIVELALQGKRVVRLKGGDPLIFGRATEELDACRAAGVAYEIIPGISAAQGAASSLGLSLTERVVARRVQFLTGHGEDGKIPVDINWPAIADPQVTTVLYMGHTTLDQFAARAFAAGLPEDTPACAIVNATRPEQMEMRAPLKRLADVIPRAPEGPVLIMIGGILRDRD
jgi:uroporphyrin-III C-methyltransferase/precorrin-2 dehydrogenase/sirohydrochlorin ferrochelatase